MLPEDDAEDETILKPLVRAAQEYCENVTGKKFGGGAVPFTIRQAMLLLIGHWYENRQMVVVGSVASVEVQATVRTLLNQHRTWWF